jgi:hypothetical protein
MRYVLFFVVLVLGYFLVQHVRLSHPSVAAGVEKGIVAPLRAVTEPIMQMVTESRLSDWIPVPLRRYTPNPYGYGGLDPAGGERKGGNGSGIPDAVAVGWWKGEEVMYPDRKLSSVEDTREEPAKPMVAEVGWWGDDWLA